METKRVHELTLSALLLAILIVCAQLNIPVPVVPFTLQLFGIGMAATILRPVYALLVVMAYIILGVIGVPVYAGFSSGIPIVIGPTGGYIWAFIIYGLFTSLWLQQVNKSPLNIFVANLIGSIIVLLLGTLWLQFIIQGSIMKSFMIGFVPFIVPTIIQNILVVLVARKLKQAHIKI